MEGVALTSSTCSTVLAGRGGPRARIVVSGGGAVSPLWRQILADTFDREVVTRAHSEDASALGAGIVAGVALGVFKSAEEAASLVCEASVLEPNPANARRYRELRQVYRSLYPELMRSFDALAGIVALSPE